jgi:lipid-A-disaccharide synthase
VKIGVLAGEASGDILGAAVLQSLRSRYPDLVVEGIGGPRMESQGLRSMFPMERLSVMGFVEPLKRLPELLQMRRAVFDHFRDNPPDVFLGIDSPDFNLQLEQKLRARGLLTAHLVSPSVWAWRQRRIRRIARAVDLMLCLFPFETKIYEDHGIPVRFVGHPLADEIPREQDTTAARQTLGLAPVGRLLALLPGSRAQEVRQLMPLFLRAARLLRRTNPDLDFIMPAVNSARMAEMQAQLAGFDELGVSLVAGRSRDVMAASDAVLLASGTATLEATLLKRPMVVAYRMGALSWQLVRRLVKTPYAALPNILSGGALVPELLQGAATPEALAAAMQPLLTDSRTVEDQKQGFDRIHAGLQQGFAEGAATALVRLLESRRDG